MNVDILSMNIEKRPAFSHQKMLDRIELFKKKISSMNVDASLIKGLSSAAIYAYRTKGNVPKGDTLEDWGTRFGLNLNWLLWGEGEMLRGVPEQPQPSQAPGPIPGSIAPFPVPVVGLAACGLEGIEQIMPYAVTASPIALGPRSVAVVALGESMVPAGIASGHMCFCDPDQTALPGEAVFFRRKDDKGALKLFLGEGTRKGYAAFRGWLPAKDAQGHQKEIRMDILHEEIDYIAPVIFVRRRL